MSDLRDSIHQPAETADETTFLDYHNRSPWALEKVKAGLRLNPEALDYMRRELAERQRSKEEYDRRVAEELENTNAQPAASQHAAAPAGGSGADAAGAGAAGDTAPSNS